VELDILDSARVSGRTYLNEIESKETLHQIGIRTTDTILASSVQEAVALAKNLGFPVVLKIVSSDIIHKSDVGGVRLNLRNSAQVAKAFHEIINSARSHYPGANIQGVSVQKMARPGVEVIMGVMKDPQFGPVLMFGLGGTMVEIMKDVSFRIIPITMPDATEMVHELRGARLLSGYRGQSPVDLDTLTDWLIHLSDFACAHPEIKEIDLNPVMAYADSALAVDARIILEENASKGCEA
jgi:acyl-CoA synthetase (NDP forming)